MFGWLLRRLRPCTSHGPQMDEAKQREQRDRQRMQEEISDHEARLRALQSEYDSFARRRDYGEH